MCGRHADAVTLPAAAGTEHKCRAEQLTACTLCLQAGPSAVVQSKPKAPRKAPRASPELCEQLKRLRESWPAPSSKMTVNGLRDVMAPLLLELSAETARQKGATIYQYVRPAESARHVPEAYSARSPRRS